jgi:predicted dehydrogenase
VYQGTYRAAIIGHTGRGNYGHGLDLAFAGLPRVEVVAVADADPAGLERAHTRTGARTAYASYQEMLHKERPDVVVVGTRWPDQHEAMLIAAAEASVKGIYSEKPLAPSPDVADRILRVCDARGVKVTVAHHNRVRPAPRLASHLVADGKIGRLRAVRTVGKCDRRSGGEDMIVLGSHLMDLMRLHAGDARWCSARVTSGGRDATRADVGRAEKEELGPLLGDDVMASFGFGDGVTGTFESTRAADGGGNDYFHLELCGTGGILAYFSDAESPVWFLPRPYVVPGRDEPWERLTPPVEVDTVPGAAPPPAGANSFFLSNRTIAGDLLESIETNRPPVNDAHNAAAALEMIVAVYASHLAGERLSFPLANRTHPLAQS